MGTFPYPYMNGRLHLGHAFTAGKVDFMTGYQRLKGKKALFPFAFHCTGMPIKACADKLKREMELYGNPPQFPVEPKQEQPEDKEPNQPKDTKPEEKGKSKKDTKPEDKPKTSKKEGKPEDKGKSKKSKTLQKAGGSKYQWHIMEASGVPSEEIHKFADPQHWLKYFPPLAQADLQDLGAKIDWRRKFITTDVNPYYDAFVRWQFNKLKRGGKIKFGKRETIYSPLDGQPCMDHDRQTGEGVGLTEYTLVKQELLRPYPKALQALEKLKQKVFLVPATLRPETMYGQTNCWVKPDGEYGAYIIDDEQVFICTPRAARNMKYQFVDGFRELKEVMRFNGEAMIGGALHAPLSKYPVIYIYPMFTILTKKTTGVVTSVPSDSPDDYAAFRDLKLKPALRQKYGIRNEQIDGFDLVPIIETPEFGKMAAVKVVDDLKIRSQNDYELLKEAHAKVYREGFYEGVILVGEHKGKKVSEVKNLIKKDLIDRNLAVRYWEPSGEVMSRSGDECVVALVDQWYLDYGEPSWQKLAFECLEQMETFGDEVRNQFVNGLEWIHEWACSRSFGLGSRIPWDPTYLIESLSDSTIYMAYYTIAHLLQGDVEGSVPGPAKVKPQQLTDEVFDFIFGHSEDYPETDIPKSVLDLCKREFNYWYPVSLRVSGKDLINNHLIFWIYNHVALFPRSKWPRGVKANGHVMLNGDKVSKSTGNFITLGDGIKRFSADGMRFALAESGDAIEDSNFTTENADNGLLRLHTFVEWCQEMVTERPNMKTGPPSTFAEKVFSANIDKCIQETDISYQKMLFQRATKFGFFDMILARDQYRQFVLSNPSEKYNWDIIHKFIKSLIVICAPITSHTSEHVWRNILKEEGSIFNTTFPVVSQTDSSILSANEYLNKTIATFRSKIGMHIRPPKKKGQPQNPYPKDARIYVALHYPDWHQEVLSILNKLYTEKGAFPDMSLIASTINSQGSQTLTKQFKKVMGLVALLKEEVEVEGASALSLSLPFNEVDVLTENTAYLETSLKLQKITIFRTTDSGLKESEELLSIGSPGKPLIFFD
uniref:leucine--tRNA ligase n=1 Tax=Arcella intermedia TaxID=1963864 RepID=A0A6B2KWU0_9EUKA